MLLQELGVDSGQGWLFAKPQPDLRALAKAYAGKVMVDFVTQPPLLEVAGGGEKMSAKAGAAKKGAVKA